MNGFPLDNNEDAATQNIDSPLCLVRRAAGLIIFSFFLILVFSGSNSSPNAFDQYTNTYNVEHINKIADAAELLDISQQPETPTPSPTEKSKTGLIIAIIIIVIILILLAICLICCYIRKHKANNDSFVDVDDNAQGLKRKKFLIHVEDGDDFKNQPVSNKPEDTVTAASKDSKTNEEERPTVINTNFSNESEENQNKEETNPPITKPAHKLTKEEIANLTPAERRRLRCVKCEIKQQVVED